LDKEIGKLEQSREKQGANKTEIDKQIKSLEDKKQKNNEVIKKVLQELGLWEGLDNEIKKGIDSEYKKGDAIDSSNSKTDAGIQKEKERSAEASRDVDKNVDVKDNGTVAFLDKIATAPKDKTVSAVDTRSTLERFNSIATSPKRSEEHTSELQSRFDLVCRLLLENKKN